MKAKSTSWNNVAPWYQNLVTKEDSYQNTVILPNLLRLLGPLKNKTVLDLACGQGFFSHSMLEGGAGVIGVDAAPDLIALAKKNIPDGTFYVAPADQIGFIKNESCDAVVIILAIQNIKEVDSTFAEAKRVLKPGGRLLLVLNHPAFRIPKQSSWDWDETNKIQYRRLDRYMSEMTSEIEMHPGQKKSTTTVSFHRPLQYYFKLLTKHGLAVTRLEEWISPKNTPAGPRADAENLARKEFPLFLFLEATKKN
jgi:ubiquinone/menaquinone biosynthesis C-methylase UbiE